MVNGRLYLVIYLIKIIVLKIYLKDSLIFLEDKLDINIINIYLHSIMKYLQVNRVNYRVKKNQVKINLKKRNNKYIKVKLLLIIKIK